MAATGMEKAAAEGAPVGRKAVNDRGGGFEHNLHSAAQQGEEAVGFLAVADARAPPEAFIEISETLEGLPPEGHVHADALHGEAQRKTRGVLRCLERGAGGRQAGAIETIEGLEDGIGRRVGGDGSGHDVDFRIVEGSDETRQPVGCSAGVVINEGNEATARGAEFVDYPAVARLMDIALQLEGTRIGDRFTAIIHRQRHDSISGLADTSTQRTHNAFGGSQDTTTFTRVSTTRTADIVASDTVTDLVFQLPHASNPWPVSGQIIRNLNATFTVTGAQNSTRTIARRVVVTFPADAEGNVQIQVGTLTCNLNLVTRKVTGCTGS